MTKLIQSLCVIDITIHEQNSFLYICEKKTSLSNEKYLGYYRHQFSLTFFKHANFPWLKIKFHDFFPDLFLAYTILQNQMKWNQVR